MTRAGTAAAAAAKAKNPPSPIKERPKVPAQPQGRQGPPTLDDEAVEKLKEWAITMIYMARCTVNVRDKHHSTLNTDYTFISAVVYQVTSELRQEIQRMQLYGDAPPDGGSLYERVPVPEQLVGAELTVESIVAVERLMRVVAFVARTSQTKHKFKESPLLILENMLERCMQILAVLNPEDLGFADETLEAATRIRTDKFRIFTGELWEVMYDLRDEMVERLGKGVINFEEQKLYDLVVRLDLCYDYTYARLYEDYPKVNAQRPKKGDSVAAAAAAPPEQMVGTPIGPQDMLELNNAIMRLDYALRVVRAGKYRVSRRQCQSQSDALLLAVQRLMELIDPTTYENPPDLVSAVNVNFNVHSSVTRGSLDTQDLLALRSTAADYSQAVPLEWRYVEHPKHGLAFGVVYHAPPLRDWRTAASRAGLTAVGAYVVCFFQDPRKFKDSDQRVPMLSLEHVTAQFADLMGKLWEEPLQPPSDGNKTVQVWSFALSAQGNLSALTNHPQATSGSTAEGLSRSVIECVYPYTEASEMYPSWFIDALLPARARTGFLRITEDGGSLFLTQKPNPAGQEKLHPMARVLKYTPKPEDTSFFSVSLTPREDPDLVVSGDHYEQVMAEWRNIYRRPKVGVTFRLRSDSPFVCQVQLLGYDLVDIVHHNVFAMGGTYGENRRLFNRSPVSSHTPSIAALPLAISDGELRPIPASGGMVAATQMLQDGTFVMTHTTPSFINA